MKVNQLTVIILIIFVNILTVKIMRQTGRLVLTGLIIFCCSCSVDREFQEEKAQILFEEAEKNGIIVNEGFSRCMRYTREIGRAHV